MENHANSASANTPAIEQARLEIAKVRVTPDGRVSRRDAAVYLGSVTERTLTNWAYEARRTGVPKGPRAIKVGGKAYYRLADLDKFINGGEAA
jgi:hypothetical protein